MDSRVPILVKFANFSVFANVNVAMKQKAEVAFIKVNVT